MDIPRLGVARKKNIWRLLFLFVFVVAASAATYRLSKLKPAAPSVDRATLWLDKVQRGSMLRDIQGTGTLVPEDIRWVPTICDGIVEKVNVRIGDSVNPDTVLVELSNQDLHQALVDFGLQVKAAEADLTNTRTSHENEVISQQITIANLDAVAKRAKLQADTNDELAKRGLIGELAVRLARLESESAESQVDREKQRVAVSVKSAQAQIAAQEARIDQLREAFEVKKFQIDQLRIRAGTSGVLQQLSIERGQHIVAGTPVAKVTVPGHLKAQLRISETQIKDILIGQIASIDTRNGIVSGLVVHIDPAAIQGTVTIDVQIKGELPKGSRPDLSIDGTIEIDRLNDVLFVGRFPNAQPGTTVQIFRVLPIGEAIRTQVHIGKVSVNSVQILEGLESGDEVILSDMSAWDGYDRIRLN